VIFLDCVNQDKEISLTVPRRQTEVCLWRISWHDHVSSDEVLRRSVLELSCQNQKTEIHWTYTTSTRRKVRKQCHQLGARGRQTESGKTIEGLASSIPQSSKTYLERSLGS